MRSQALSKHGTILPHQSFIPLLVFHTKDMRGKLVGHNNPWAGRAQFSVETMNLSINQPESSDHGLKESWTTILQLPKVAGEMNIEQISTMGRFIGM